MKKVISQDDQRFIDKFIAPQLQAKIPKAKVVFNGQTFLIDYMVIDNGDPIDPNEVVVLLTGFGSGWRGIAMLGYYLAKCGRRVVMVSMPGYGNSSNPFPPYYLTEGFGWEAHVLNKFLEKVFPGKKCHLVGHSMASCIIVEHASLHPENVASLTLLDPAGLYKRNALEIGLKFVLNGIMHGIDFKGDPTWATLEKYLPREQSPFSSERLQQRRSEWRRLCNDCTYFLLQQIKDGIPIFCIAGKRDSVFPHNKLLEAIGIPVIWKFKEFVAIDTWHNSTMYNSDITAETINEFLIT